jgi:hypothetical protein
LFRLFHTTQVPRTPRQRQARTGRVHKRELLPETRRPQRPKLSRLDDFSF